MTNRKKTAAKPAAAKPAAAKPAATKPARREMRPATVEIDPPRCICCFHTEFSAVKKIGEQFHHGHRENGERYTSIVRRRVRCVSCEQVQIHKTYHFDADRWAQGTATGKPDRGESADGESAA